MADEGAPAVAVEAGTIVKVDDVDDGLGGLSVWLLGESGVAYYYAHNSENLVVAGQRVARGETIARVGRTGNARTTPPHIHFQMNLCGEISSAEPCTVDPRPFLLAWDQEQGGSGGQRPEGTVDGASAPAASVGAVPGTDDVAWYEPATGTFGTPEGVDAPPAPVESDDVGVEDGAPVAGDWDGDGRASLGIYRRDDATFQLFDDDGELLDPVVLGEPGQAGVWPVAGDFDGTGRDTVGLYRQADGAFVMHVEGFGASPPVPVGTPGRTDAFPVAGDWEGSGRDGLGVYHRADGSLVLWDGSFAPLPAANAAVDGAGAFPVAGDWDGDGRDTVGVLRPDPDSGAMNFDLPAATAGRLGARRKVPVDATGRVLPVAGDWDGPETLSAETSVTEPNDETSADATPADTAPPSNVPQPSPSPAAPDTAPSSTGTTTTAPTPSVPPPTDAPSSAPPATAPSPASPTTTTTVPPTSSTTEPAADGTSTSTSAPPPEDDTGPQQPGVT